MGKKSTVDMKTGGCVERLGVVLNRGPVPGFSWKSWIDYLLYIYLLFIYIFIFIFIFIILYIYLYLFIYILIYIYIYLLYMSVTEQKREE